MIHARGFIFSQRRGERKEFLQNVGHGGLGGLARDNSGNSFFCSRKGAEDAKEFLRNAGLGGLGGLARDINDSCARIYFLAKAQRTQRIPIG